MQEPQPQRSTQLASDPQSSALEHTAPTGEGGTSVGQSEWHRPAVQVWVGPQAPHDPPQPSSPHAFAPSSAGAHCGGHMHWPAVHAWPMGQAPQ